MFPFKLPNNIVANVEELGEEDKKNHVFFYDIWVFAYIGFVFISLISIQHVASLHRQETLPHIVSHHTGLPTVTLQE